MATKIDWKSLGGREMNGSSKKSKSDSKTRYLKFESGKMYKIRPIGEGYTFSKFFIKGKNGNRSATVSVANSQKASMLISAHTGTEIKPTQRFAMNVIDRSDGQIKVMEGGMQIFGPFAAWSMSCNDAPPGGKNGCDWSIIVKGEGTDREYQCVALPDRSPLTQEEISLAKSASDKGGAYKLEDVYKETPLEEIVERLYGKSAPETNGSSQEAPAIEENTQVNDAITF